MAKLDYQLPADPPHRKRVLAAVSAALAIIAAFLVSLLFILPESALESRVAVLAVWGGGFGGPLAGIVLALLGIVLRRNDRALSGVALVLSTAALGYTVAAAFHFTD